MLAVFGLGPQEIVLLAVVGVLLFGRKLPETARYLGRSFIEFQKGWKGVEDPVEGTPIAAPAAAPVVPQRVPVTGPKYQEGP